MSGALDLDELDLLRAGFQHLSQSPGPAAAMFYDRLFEIAPETRALFTADMEAQGAKMMSMLGAIVARLHDIDALHPLVSDLARRHVAYGVRPRHYATLQEAMLWTLARALGPRFTPEAERAWSRAFGELTRRMLEAAYPSGPAA